MTKLPMQELDLQLNVQGACMREGGGVIAGLHGTCVQQCFYHSV